LRLGGGGPPQCSDSTVEMGRSVVDVLGQRAGAGKRDLHGASARGERGLDVFAQR
jgi:hypothetical protein